MQFDINQIIRVDAKLYRHFAVLTIVVTLCVAFFADTDNRQAVANEMDRRDQQTALRKAEEEKQAKNHSTFTNKSVGPPMSDDFGTYGAPTDTGSGKGTSSALPLPRASSQKGLREVCGRDAADRDALARMNDLQREAYLAKLDEMDCSQQQRAEAQPHQPTQSEISALAAASAARSGASSVD